MKIMAKIGDRLSEAVCRNAVKHSVAVGIVH